LLPKDKALKCLKKILSVENGTVEDAYDKGFLRMTKMKELVLDDTIPGSEKIRVKFKEKFVKIAIK